MLTIPVVFASAVLSAMVFISIQGYVNYPGIPDMLVVSLDTFFGSSFSATFLIGVFIFPFGLAGIGVGYAWQGVGSKKLSSARAAYNVAFLLAVFVGGLIWLSFTAESV